MFDDIAGPAFGAAYSNVIVVDVSAKGIKLVKVVGIGRNLTDGGEVIVLHESLILELNDVVVVNISAEGIELVKVVGIGVDLTNSGEVVVVQLDHVIIIDIAAERVELIEVVSVGVDLTDGGQIVVSELHSRSGDSEGGNELHYDFLL